MQEKKIIEFIERARKAGFSDDIILQEIIKQSEVNRDAFLRKEQDNASPKEVLDKIISGNIAQKEEKANSLRENNQFKKERLDKIILFLTGFLIVFFLGGGVIVFLSHKEHEKNLEVARKEDSIKRELKMFFEESSLKEEVAKEKEVAGSGAYPEIFFSSSMKENVFIGEGYEIKWTCPSQMKQETIDFYIISEENKKEEIKKNVDCSLENFLWFPKEVLPEKKEVKIKIEYIWNDDLIKKRSENYFTLRKKTNESSFLRMPILMYHHIEDLPEDASKEWKDLTVTPSMFKEQMKYLYENNYNPITFEKFIDLLNNGKEIPENYLIISFDDGWKNQYENAFPVLKEYDFVATFFLVGNYVGGGMFMDWDNVNELIEYGMEIGSHSMNHPNLNKEDKEGLLVEIVGSRDFFQRRLDISIDFFAYPYGALNYEVLDRVESAGYKAARGTEYGVYQDVKELYNLKTIQVYNKMDQFKKIFSSRQ